MGGGTADEDAVSQHRHLTPLDPQYPSRLRGFAHSPAALTLSGGPLEAECTVAVVGSRAATSESLVRTRALCRTLAQYGVVIVSGGAIGVDAAAHRATLEAIGGRTWAIAATAPGRCFPECHEDLFDTIAAGPGTVLWPLSGRSLGRSAFLQRNCVLATLSDAVVVMQAGKPSGALHAAGWARKLGRPLWVAVPSSPSEEHFAGSRQLLDEGAAPLDSIERLVAALASVGPSGGGGPTCGAAAPVPGGRGRPCSNPAYDELSPENTHILSLLSNVPMHLDSISSRANRSAQATAAALLTLALENVVVEGPPGFFRRQNS